MKRDTNKSTTTISTPSDVELRFTRAISAPKRVVFDAWTSPRLVPRWLLGPDGWTMPVCEVDLRPGGAWRYVWKKSDGPEMEIRGTYVEVAPPDRVVTTERWGPEWPETVNTVALDERSGVTTMTLTIRYPTQAAREAARVTGMAEGVEASFRRLDELARTLV